MLISKKLTIDLVNQSPLRSIHAVQCDCNTRAVEVMLTAKGAQWKPPEGTAVSVAFKKPDGNKGWYDRLPDGSSACNVTGNAVTVILAPEMLTAPGRVEAAIVFQDADLNQLSTFSFIVEVAPNPAAGGVISNSYYKYSTMADVNAAMELLDNTIAELERAKANGEFKGEKGDKGDKGDTGEQGPQGIQGEKGEAPDAVLYTEQTLTPEQQALARANIGAVEVVGEYIVHSVEIQEGYYDCREDYVSFASHPNFRSARVSCTAGEKYRISTYIPIQYDWPVAWLYSAEEKLIATVGGLTGNDNGHGEQIVNFEFTIPENCAFFITTSFYGGIAYSNIEKYETKELATVEYVNRNLVKRETAFRDLYTELKPGYYDCRTNGVEFVETNSYRSAQVFCVEGEKYRISTYIPIAFNWPVAWLYSTAGLFLGTVGGLTGNDNGHGEYIVDFEFTIPANCAFFITSSLNTPNYWFRIKKYAPGVKPLFGRNAIYLGDSITADANRWRTEFNSITGANEVLCKAVSGATLCDYADTVVDGVDYSAGHKNTISNQVQDIINNPPIEPIDLIVISAGTNDHANLEEFQGDITQFADDTQAYINVDTVDRTRYDGAMRWIAEKLWNMFPDAVIFFATPIQGAEALRKTHIQLLKSDYMQKVAAYLGTPVIDATRKSGIYGRYETSGAEGKYLRDGLHPNLAGGAKLGRYYASEVINYFAYLQD